MTLTGRFAHDRASYVRTLAPGIEAGSPQGLKGSGFGVFVMTPFITRTCDAAGKCTISNIYVNRGFLPTRADGKLPAFERNPEVTTIMGLLRPSESEGLFPPRNEPGRRSGFSGAPTRWRARLACRCRDARGARQLYGRFIDLQASPDERDPPMGGAGGFPGLDSQQSLPICADLVGLGLDECGVLAFFLHPAAGAAQTHREPEHPTGRHALYLDRGEAPALSFADCLLAGLARDGGLYLPKPGPS